MKLNKLLAQAPKKEPKAVPTGIASLDAKIGGLHIGHVCTVAARPAMGKTAFAMTLARNIGIMNKVPTAILSLEHAEDHVVERLFATEFGWRNRKAQIPSFVAPKVRMEMDRVSSLLQGVGFKAMDMLREEFVQKMKEAPVWIEHGVNITMDELIARAERLKKNENIQVLIIDGLNWIVAGQTYIERGQAMQKLVQTASRLNIAVLVTMDLSRTVEERVGNWPMLSDLRGGFSAETYSATVLFIYRPEYYGIMEDEQGSTLDLADIIVAKNTFGDVGRVRLGFPSKARFEDTDISLPLLDDILSEDVPF